MHKFLHETEVFIDRSIPFFLAGLPAVLIIEIYFSWIKDKYFVWFDLFDIAMVAVLLIDLFFKYERVKNTKKFIRKYWFDIIAAFPFFIIFRFLEIFRLSEALKSGQQVLHETIQIERTGQRLIEEAEAVGEVSRTERFLRYFKVFGRFPRFCEAFPFFEHPNGKHQHGKKEK